MKKIIVRGNRPLRGEITVSGSKNAALPILFATLITEGVSEIRNLPDIGDVRAALSILDSFGAKVSLSYGTAFIDTTSLTYKEPDAALVASLRASTYLIGACLSRFGVCRLLPFGGCNFAKRPIDMHIDAACTLGARLDGDVLSCKGLHGADIFFDKPSVGATVNSLLLASCADGTTRIFGAAREPHIDALIDYLVSSGGDIKKHPDCIRVEGRPLKSGKQEIIGDMIEAGSYLSLSLLSGGNIGLRSCPSLECIADTFLSLGAELCTDGDLTRVRLRDGCRYTKIITAPYPGFPTDMQPLMAPALASLCGGEIIDNVWQSRFGYLTELEKFGISSCVRDSHAFIAPSDIRAARAFATDLRGGMACVLSALSASGESEIGGADTVLRGYERLSEKLRSVGAEIDIIDEQ